MENNYGFIYDKLILIVNGKPRAGKDTFAQLLNRYIPVYKYSSVEKVKCIALDCGWKGGKSEKDRKFLSDLKKLTSEYSDMAYNDVLDRIEKFDTGEIKEHIFIVDVREPEEIDRLKEAVGAITVYIENDNVPDITSNEADANVANYEYDICVDNSGTLEDFDESVRSFLYLLSMMCMDRLGELFPEEDEEEGDE